MDKKSMRRCGLTSRRALSEEQRQDKSRLIVEKLLQSSVFQEARTVFCYVSMDDEVNTRQILQAVLETGRILAIPYITDVLRGLMKPVRLHALEDLTPGLYDIPTVPAGRLEDVRQESVDLVVVPGTAFDFAGHRIGMGGGYYDRFLAGSGAVKAALAYKCQIFSELPAEKYDQKVNYIFTEDKIYKERI